MTEKSSWLRVPRAVTATVSLDHAPFGVIWLDDRGGVGYANAAAKELLGRSGEDLVNRAVFELIPGWSAAAWGGWIEQLRKAPAAPLQLDPVPLAAVEGGVVAVRLARMEIAGMEMISVYLAALASPTPELSGIAPVLPDFVQNLPVGIALVTPVLEILDLNPALSAIAGADRAELVGRSLAEWLEPPEGPPVPWPILFGADPSPMDFRFINGRGQQFDLRVSVARGGPGLDGAERHAVFVENQTELVQLRQRLEQQEHSFERLANNTPGMIYKFVMSADGHASFPYASPGSRDIWEIDPALVREDATPILNLIHPEDLGAFQDSVMKSASELSPWEFEGRIITPSGRVKWFHAASRPELADHGDIVWQGLLMDITHQKEIEAELKAAKRKAEAAADSKANFLANMSHEIRTPMNGVIGMAELLDRTPLEPRQKYYVDTIRSSAEVLLTIINDILDLSKIEAGKLLLHPAVFDLRRLLEEVATLLAPRAFEKGLEVVVRIDPRAPSRVVGDAVRLRQVLTNLIGNAIKFTHAGHVLIQVQELEVNGDEAHLRFVVEDTGIGISPEAMERIFEKFEQADASTSRRYEGTGLGLTISRQLVAMMGGQMHAESELDRGSRFYFDLRLPFREEPSDPHYEDRGLGEIRILAVDDHPVNRELLREIFETWVVDHEIVGSGPEALTVLRRAARSGRGFDVVVLDYHMPGMDGLSLAAAIHAEPELGDLVKIMLSSSSFNEDQQRRLAEAKVSAQLLKPLRMQELREVLIANCAGRGSAAATPHSTVPLASGPGVEPVAEGVEGLKVMLVEDNEVNTEIAFDMLRTLHLAVDCAENGRRAVELARTQRYDLIFMDCQMPELDGFQATRQIRALAQVPAPVIVAMTAYAMAGDRERCIEAGMDDYLPKPVTFANLRAVTEKSLKLVRERRERATSMAAGLQHEVGGESSVPAAPPPRAPLFAVEVGLEVTGGKVEVLQRAIEIWWKKLPIWLNEMKQGIQQENFAEVGRIAHTLRGAAANIGALSIAQAAERMEAEIQRHSLADIIHLYECLVLDAERLSHATAELLAGTSAKTGH